jgi:hypothetical protein
MAAVILMREFYQIPAGNKVFWAGIARASGREKAPAGFPNGGSNESGGGVYFFP